MQKEEKIGGEKVVGEQQREKQREREEGLAR